MSTRGGSKSRTTSAGICNLPRPLHHQNQGGRPWDDCHPWLDKFFNTNEVRETAWDFIQERTKGPYELSLKENGCIIFISSLEDGTLLVCSKHSTGDGLILTSAMRRWVSGTSSASWAASARPEQDLA